MAFLPRLECRYMFANEQTIQYLGTPATCSFLGCWIAAVFNLSSFIVAIHDMNSVTRLNGLQTYYLTGGSTGLVVMGGGSLYEGLGFEFRHRILDGHFFTLICCKIALMLVWKRLKINEKEAGDDPLKKLIMLQNYRKHYGNTGYILSQHLVTLSMIQFVIWQVLRQTTQSPILPIVSELYLVNIQISYAWN